MDTASGTRMLKLRRLEQRQVDDRLMGRGVDVRP